MSGRWSRKPGRRREPSLAKIVSAESTRVLSAADVRRERLALAADMLHLLLDDPLAPATQPTVRELYEGVLALWRACRDRP